MITAVFLIVRERLRHFLFLRSIVARGRAASLIPDSFTTALVVDKAHSGRLRFDIYTKSPGRSKDLQIRQFGIAEVLCALILQSFIS